MTKISISVGEPQFGAGPFYREPEQESVKEIYKNGSKTEFSMLTRINLDF